MTLKPKPAIKVLVAEDHPIVADGIVAILVNAKDMEVVGRARDGAETIDLIKRLRPDIVLLDLRMPVVDGIGVARWIKRSGSPTRTVILTSFQSDSDVGQALRAGVNAYLLKDTPPGEILRTIRRVHQGATPFRAGRHRALSQNVGVRNFKPTELETLALLMQGYDNRTIGNKLGIHTCAVKYRLRVLFSKLGVRRRSAAVIQAIERGLLKTG